MSKFNVGQLVTLKSDKNIKGVVVSVTESVEETRYSVFTNSNNNLNEIQVYYESQLISENQENSIKRIGLEEFNAELTSSLICNPTISSLYSLNTAKIDFIPYQFRPVLKFIKSDRPRLLIADGVGVGKTIEAGLILRELQARRNLDSVLIICPRPLISEEKWESEMKRFDEDFEALDGEKFRHCINEYDLEGEWPDKYKKAVVPYSLFDEMNVFGSSNGKKSKIGLMDIDPPKFDLVIVDEAHHVRNTATYAYKAVSRFCDAAEAVIFLTATPVQLEYDDLYVLLNLLRPDLIIDKTTFHDMAEPNAFINMASMLIRSQKENWAKESLDEIHAACDTAWGRKVFKENPLVNEIIKTLSKDVITAEERVQLISDVENIHTFSNIINRTRRRDIGEFTIRKPITVKVDFTKEQRILHDGILEIMHELLSSIHCTDNTKFMMTTIRRQTASCLFGLVPMLEDILNRHVDELIDDRYFNGINEENSVEQIKIKINEMINLANKMPKEDPKLEALLDIITKKQEETKKKVMIFSSFRHTLNYLFKKLNSIGVCVGIIHGDIADDERRELRRRFNPLETDENSKESIDVLLFSEVGCEGLDYQFCDCMINYDLPWNPMRVEQRIGRIDRNGQTSDSVSIYNMIIPGTVDADIYERCLYRIGVFHSSIGDCEEILGEVTGEIRKLAENFQITDEERKEKLQQMTDNKIRYIKAQQELEEKQKDLFGLRVPESTFDQELKNATNYWLSVSMIQNMVCCYLEKLLGENKEYFLGEKDIKTLRLSQSAREALLEESKKLKIPANAVKRAWEKWLKSGEQHLPVSFEASACKDNNKITLLSITHPLVKQAAKFLQNNNKTVTTLKVKTNKVAKGNYSFVIYQWKYLGEHEDLVLKPIASDKAVTNQLTDLLKLSENAACDFEVSDEIWDEVENNHHEIWQKELAEHKNRTEDLIRYKEASLKTSHNARLATLFEQLSKSSDKKYQIMTEGKINIAKEDFERHMRQLEDARNKADVLIDLLSYGILIVEEA